MFGEVGFESLCKFTPRQHHAPPAALALEPDIRTETRNGPFVRAARMLFAEPQVVVETEVGEHN